MSTKTSPRPHAPPCSAADFWGRKPHGVGTYLCGRVASAVVAVARGAGVVVELDDGEEAEEAAVPAPVGDHGLVLNVRIAAAVEGEQPPLF